MYIHPRYFYIHTQAGRYTHAHILRRPFIAALFHLYIYMYRYMPVHKSLVLMAYAMAQMSMRICRVSPKHFLLACTKYGVDVDEDHHMGVLRRLLRICDK